MLNFHKYFTYNQGQWKLSKIECIKSAYFITSSLVKMCPFQKIIFSPESLGNDQILGVQFAYPVSSTTTLVNILETFSP